MHDHDHASAAARHWRPLTMVLVLTAAYMVAEAVGSLVSNSLALMADAGHMLADAFGLGLALFAIWLGARPASPARTYGYYRAEILAAMANAMVLFAISGFVLYEAWRRLHQPPDVQSATMLAIASVGLVVNLVGAWLLRKGAKDSLNIQGAFLEVVSDTLGSLGVIIAGILVATVGWTFADPLFSILIGLFIIPRTWRLLRGAVGILLEGTPVELDLGDIRAAMEAVPCVDSVHDLHVWCITSGYVSLTAHARVSGAEDRMKTLAALNTVLTDRFHIEHATIQLEEHAYADDERAVHA